MEDKKTLFDYISDWFATFGIITVIFVILNLIIGDAARGLSTFFEYGKNALPCNTLLQILGLSLIICVCRNLLFTDRWIKKMSMLVRDILFFVTITVVIIVFVVLFKWFPLLDPKAWIGFIVSFAFCSALGIVISRIKEKAEDKKMDQALEKYKMDQN